jgi:hypothetical protein
LVTEKAFAGREGAQHFKPARKSDDKLPIRFRRPSAGLAAGLTPTIIGRFRSQIFTPNTNPD